MRTTFLTAVGLFALAPLSAQPGPSRGRMPRYDVATEGTFKGTVEAVREVDHAGFRGKGFHATFRAEQGTFDVHFGPVAFLNKEKLEIVKGDQLEVVGSRVRDAEGESVIARTVKKRDTTVTLRDASGIPMWGGGRRKNR